LDLLYYETTFHLVNNAYPCCLFSSEVFVVGNPVVHVEIINIV